MSNHISASPPRVMVVDDDPGFCEQLSAYLEAYGCYVRAVTSPHAFGPEFRDFAPDVIVLDQRLGDTTGTQILRSLRADHDTPCIVVTGLPDPTDRIVNLEVGADDEVDKSVSPRELLARIRAVLRRSAGEATTTGKGTTVAAHGEGRWRLLLERRELRRPDGSLCELTTAEFETLGMLYNNAGTVVSRAALSEAIFGRKLVAGDRAVDTVVRKLRRKISPDADVPCIHTHRTIGYVFVRFPDAPAAQG